VLTMPAEIDPEKVTCAFEHGILTVYAPKAPSAQPKQVAVKVKTAK
jgi:HSP20 family molecular chaperone IbpA